MNEIQKKVKEKLIEPATNSRSLSNLYAIVRSSNEKANLCNIRYKNKDGKSINKNNVSVLITDTSIISWFPQVNEKVLVQEKNNDVYIIGPAYFNYEEIRKSMELKNDIFSNSFVDTMGGFLF